MPRFNYNSNFQFIEKNGTKYVRVEDIKRFLVNARIHAEPEKRTKAEPITATDYIRSLLDILAN